MGKTVRVDRMNLRVIGVFKAKGRTREAEQAYHRARIVLEKLSAEFPTVSLYRDDFIHSHCYRGW